MFALLWYKEVNTEILKLQSQKKSLTTRSHEFSSQSIMETWKWIEPSFSCILCWGRQRCIVKERFIERSYYIVLTLLVLYNEDNVSKTKHLGAGPSQSNMMVFICRLWIILGRRKKAFSQNKSISKSGPRQAGALPLKWYFSFFCACKFQILYVM